jgi:hypothetical protein
MTQRRAGDRATPPTTSEKETLSEVVPRAAMDAMRHADERGHSPPWSFRSEGPRSRAPNDGDARNRVKSEAFPGTSRSSLRTTRLSQ